MPGTWTALPSRWRMQRWVPSSMAGCLSRLQQAACRCCAALQAAASTGQACLAGQAWRVALHSSSVASAAFSGPGPIAPVPQPRSLPCLYLCSLHLCSLHLCSLYLCSLHLARHPRHTCLMPH
jgi:hypothetical protein